MVDDHFPSFPVPISLRAIIMQARDQGPITRALSTRALCSHCSVVLHCRAVYDLTTLSNTELKHARAIASTHASRVGVVDKPQAC